MPYLKAHVVSLEKLKSDMASWPRVDVANLKPKFKDANELANNVFFQKMVVENGVDRDTLKTWLFNCVTRAHRNILSLLCAQHFDAKYSYVGLQMILRRVNVLEINDSRTDFRTIADNVCYRVENIVVPFSRASYEENKLRGFTGAMYYQYEHDEVLSSVMEPSRSANSRDRNLYWGIIGSRKFWKHWRALHSKAREARKFTICTAPGLDELKQMSVYVKLLGITTLDWRLGRLVYAVSFKSAAAHNMGILRTLFSYLPALQPDDEDADVPRRGAADEAPAASKPLADYIEESKYHCDGQTLLQETRQVKDLPHYRHSRKIRRPPDANTQCKYYRNEQRGAVDNFDESGYTTRVTRRGKQRCIGSKTTTSPLWDDVLEMSANMNGGDTTMYIAAFRMLLSEWNLRSFAIIKKWYVRCGSSVFLNEDDLTTAREPLPCPGGSVWHEPPPCKDRATFLGQLKSNAARIMSRADMHQKLQDFLNKVRTTAANAAPQGQYAEV